MWPVCILLSRWMDALICVFTYLLLYNKIINTRIMGKKLLKSCRKWYRIFARQNDYACHPTHYFVVLCCCHKVMPYNDSVFQQFLIWFPGALIPFLWHKQVSCHSLIWVAMCTWYCLRNELPPEVWIGQVTVMIYNCMCWKRRWIKSTLKQ